MAASFEELQDAYIEEVRAFKPDLYAWWLALTGIEQMNETPGEEFLQTWPFRVSGHPRIIAIFRRFYLAVEHLNEVGTAGQTNPVDLLICDIQDKAPDIFKIAAGIVYVPVGLDHRGRSV